MRVPNVADADRRRIVITDMLHLATGYPATRFANDFQTLIKNHPNQRHLVRNAYEPHTQI
jgi:hypothetical protein